MPPIVTPPTVPNLLRRWYWLLAIILTLCVWVGITLAMRPLTDADGSHASYPYGLITDLDNKALDLLFQLRDATATESCLTWDARTDHNYRD